MSEITRSRELSHWQKFIESNPYCARRTFEEVPVTEIRQVCLAVLKQKHRRFDNPELCDWCERMIKTLSTPDRGFLFPDTIWIEVSDFYLFHSEDESAIRAVNFLLDWHRHNQGQEQQDPDMTKKITNRLTRISDWWDTDTSVYDRIPDFKRYVINQLHAPARHYHRRMSRPKTFSSSEWEHAYRALRIMTTYSEREWKYVPCFRAHVQVIIALYDHGHVTPDRTVGLQKGSERLALGNAEDILMRAEQFWRDQGSLPETSPVNPRQLLIPATTLFPADTVDRPGPMGPFVMATHYVDPASISGGSSHDR